MAEIKYLDKEGLEAFAGKVKDFVEFYHASHGVKYMFEITDTLPALPTSKVEADKLFHKFFFIKKAGDTQDNNIYDQYVLLNKGTEDVPVYAWERIGNTDVNLNGYIKSGSSSDGSLVVTSQTLIDGDNLDIKHTNTVTAKTTDDTDQNPDFGGTVVIPSIQYDETGHITSTTTSSITLPNVDRGLTSVNNKVGHANTPIAAATKGGTKGEDATVDLAEKIIVPRISYDNYGHIIGASETNFHFKTMDSVTPGKYQSNTVEEAKKGFKVAEITIDSYGRVTNIENKQHKAITSGTNATWDATGTKLTNGTEIEELAIAVFGDGPYKS